MANVFLGVIFSFMREISIDWTVEAPFKGASVVFNSESATLPWCTSTCSAELLDRCCYPPECC